MKTTPIIVLYFICGVIGFVSCSGGEESINERLSEETTPITFELDNGWEHFLFDYTASGRYIGSDTFTINNNNSKQTTTNLRQGKHKLVWLKGLKSRYIYSESEITDPVVLALVTKENTGLQFVPDNKTLIRHDEGILRHNIFYCEKSLEVTQYLMTTQKLSYFPVTCVFEIVFTDANIWSPNKFYLSFPFVSEVGLTDNRYKIMSKPHYITISLYNDYYIGNGYYNGHQIITSDNDVDNTNKYTSFCPLDGLDNIQLTCGIIDTNGQLVTVDAKGITIPFTPLPKISLRRGYTTKLTGPLLNGSISDWKVTMEPFSHDN